MAGRGYASEFAERIHQQILDHLSIFLPTIGGNSLNSVPGCGQI
jgi:hypothetical protein